MPELQKLLDAYGESGGDKGILTNKNIPCIFASRHSVLSMRKIEGLDVQAKEVPRGVIANIRVIEGSKIKSPIYLCFGVLDKNGEQEIIIDVKLEKNASASFIAHCLFPNALKVKHTMDGRMEIGEGAEMKYSENHYHGPYGGTEVIPKAIIKIRTGGSYFSDFNIITGKVGKLDIDYSVEVGEKAVAELIARIFGHGSDDIKINEKVSLAGENSRGLIKTRVAIEDQATSEVINIAEGSAKGARGHMDCMEIVKDKAVAKAIPIVNVSHPLAKVTHEAAIGSIDKKQLETLMAHGLTPEQAVDVVVKGVLR
jgi:Fe-S cluster assembly scaffold protein SufB